MEPGSSIELQFTYLPGDLEHAYWVQQATRPMLWVSGAVALCALVGGGLTFYGLAVSTLWSKVYHDAYVYRDRTGLVLGAVCVLLAFFLWFDPLGRLMRRLMVQRNWKFYTSPARMAFRDAGVTFARQAAEERFQWAFFRGAVEGSREFLLLAAQGEMYLVVPKRAVGSAEGETELREMLKRKVGKFAVVRRVPPLFLP